MDESKLTEVHGFWTYDKGIEAPALAPFKATRESIATVWKGRVADGTEQWVDDSQLDDRGRYRRIPTGWGELA